MSQITRCPHCQTCFKIVADQLRVADGWVRCGQCQQIFDAAAHVLQPPPAPELVPDLLLEPQLLTPEPVAASADRPAPALSLGEPLWRDEEAPPGGVVPEDDEAPTVFPQLEFADPIGDDGEAFPATDDQEGLHAEQPWEPLEVGEGGAGGHPIAIPELDLPGHSEPFLDTPGVANPSDGEDAAPSVSALLAAPVAEEPVAVAAPESAEMEESAAAPQSEAEPEEAAPTVLPEEAEPGFVKAARRGAFWRRPAVRGLLLLAGIALGLALVLQVAVHERDVLAARYPQARAWLQQLCAPIGCVVQAPRRIADVVIEASSFVKGRGGDATYALEVSLKNQAPMAVAMPALELTLVDAMGQAVVRRVLRREDIASPATLDAGALWSGSARLRVTEGAERVVGYRVLAFYP